MNQLVGNVFLVRGNEHDIEEVLHLLLENKYPTSENPDLYVRSYRQFGITDAQELRMRAQTKALQDRRVFVIATSTITTEAQNALLKTLEEPAMDALFFFLVPTPEALLATVRSRAQILDLKKKEEGSQQLAEANAFLKASPKDRLEMLKSVLEKDDDDKYDTGAILAFLASLEKVASLIQDSSLMSRVAKSVYQARLYANDKGALMKVLLESVALTAPEV